MTFLSTKNPPTKTNGSITGSPTHQLEFKPNRTAAATMEKAAGLKICILPKTTRYFDAIAKMPTKIRKKRFAGKEKGPTIRARIRAVMEADSILVGARTALANSVLLATQTTNRTRTVEIMANGPYGNTPTMLKNRAATTKEIR